ncbi:hypothetical protein GW17_00000479 [Ensete ventricosum]|nr:hypothetical protein GW17_00000479 [Ensete ventricosum]
MGSTYWSAKLPVRIPLATGWYRQKSIVGGQLREKSTVSGRFRTYYNDLHVFDLDQFKWQEIKPRPGCMWPCARSGFQLFVFQDEVSELLLRPRIGRYVPVRQRIGTQTARYQVVPPKSAVGSDLLMSLFMNELYGFQLDSHRWYPLELRKDKSTKDKVMYYCYRYTDRLLPGSTAKIDRRRSIEGEKGKKKKKKEVPRAVLACASLSPASHRPFFSCARRQIATCGSLQEQYVHNEVH